MKIDLKSFQRSRRRRECGCIFGLCSKSTSNTTNQNQQVAASEGSLAVGAGGQYQEQGSVNLTGASNLQLAPTLTTQGGGNITITSDNADILTKALDANAQLSSQFGSSLNQFVSQASEDQAQKVATLLAATDAAKESQSTTAQNSKTFVIIIIAVIALLGFLGLRKS